MNTRMSPLWRTAWIAAIVLALSGPFNSTAQANDLDYPSVWTCDAPKFNWYCDMDTPASAPVAATPPTPAAPKDPDDFSQIKTADEMREAMKQRLDVANMQPTPEHIRSYLKLWQYVQDKGATFADQWRRVVWQDQGLDYSLKRPTNNVAVHTYDDQRNTSQDAQLRALAQKHGLIFFFRSDCPYCHAMAPTMKLLASRFGIEVFPVSLDARGIAEFPHPAVDHGEAAAWGVQQVPALFIASKDTGDHAMIGSGALALQDIIDRIFVLTASKPGELF